MRPVTDVQLEAVLKQINEILASYDQRLKKLEEKPRASNAK